MKQYTVVVGEPTEKNTSPIGHVRRFIGQPLLSGRVPTDDINIAHQVMQDCCASNLKWTYLVKEVDQL